MISKKKNKHNSSDKVCFKNKLVSIITPTYNSEKYLEDSILSVLNQTYNKIEYIIIDGGSNDKSIDLIKKYKKKIDIYISEKDKGVYDAINKGISLSNGEFIFYLASGDILKTNSIEKCINIYNKINNNNIKNDKIIINGFIEKINNDGNKIGIWKTDNKIIKGYNAFNHSTWFVPKSIFNKFGLYSLDYKICSDYDYFLKLMKNNIIFYTIREPLMCFRVGGISNSFETLKERLIISLKYTNLIEAYLDFIKRLIIKFLSTIKSYLR